MNDLVLLVAVVLFPGLIATIIADRLVVHVRPWTSFKYTIYSFVFGVSCYAGLQIFVTLVGWIDINVEFLPSLAGRLDVWSLVSTRDAANVELSEVLAATLCAIPIACLGAIGVNRKWLNRIAQFFQISRKYGDENLYSYYLNSDEIDWVYVRDIERKLTYQGRVNAYCETSALQEIVLAEVTIFGYENSEEYYSIPSIYIGRELGNLIIEAIPPDHLGSSNGQESDNQRGDQSGHDKEGSDKAGNNSTAAPD